MGWERMSHDERMYMRTCMKLTLIVHSWLVTVVGYGWQGLTLPHTTSVNTTFLLSFASSWPPRLLAPPWISWPTHYPQNGPQPPHPAAVQPDLIQPDLIPSTALIPRPLQVHKTIITLAGNPLRRQITQALSHAYTPLGDLPRSIMLPYGSQVSVTSPNYCPTRSLEPTPP